MLYDSVGTIRCKIAVSVSGGETTKTVYFVPDGNHSTTYKGDNYAVFLDGKCAITRKVERLGVELSLDKCKDPKWEDIEAIVIAAAKCGRKVQVTVENGTKAPKLMGILVPAP